MITRKSLLQSAALGQTVILCINGLRVTPHHYLLWTMTASLLLAYRVWYFASPVLMATLGVPFARRNNRDVMNWILLGLWFPIPAGIAMGIIDHKRKRVTDEDRPRHPQQSQAGTATSSGAPVWPWTRSCVRCAPPAQLIATIHEPTMSALGGPRQTFVQPAATYLLRK